jgi:hypothetical protein
MAWITISFDDTLVQDMGDGQIVPVPGAPEAVMQLMNEGHRLTVVTSRFAPMPDSERARLKEQLEQDLQMQGFPPMEVWTGTTRPDSDIHIGAEAITFDKDWGLALAQLSVMLEERGLIPGPQPDDGLVEEDVAEEPGQEGGEEAEPEEKKPKEKKPEAKGEKKEKSSK